MYTLLILQPGFQRHQELHVNALQRYPHAAVKDGLDLQTIRDLASLANWGKCMGNVERDLHTMVPFLFGTQIPLYNIGIEVYDPDLATTCEKEFPILLASDVLHALWGKQSPQLWDIVIGCTSAKAHEFWTAFRSNPGSCDQHPVIQCSIGIRVIWLLVFHQKI